ncbi:hypothetical protein F4777DRAFT_590766 [Nemania sp. FL0916]|nr:hypothetical protein F4777DRAFT_590766 [Nemania sp. FL0916]
MSSEKHRPSRKSWTTRPWVLPVLVHVSIFLTYTILFLWAYWGFPFGSRYRSADIIASNIIASATSAIEYGTRVFDEIDDLDEYFGKPTPELESRWTELLKYQWLQIPESDMEKLGRVEEGIQLPDGGYFATLAVYHDLHCLRRIHHVLYRDHYFPNLTADERFLDDRHAAHCLDSIRQSVQCAGDVSLLTMRWGTHTRVPLANFTSPHECVNWNHIQDWAHDRVYDVMAPGVLIHPKLGASYPDGKPGLGVGRDS